MFSKIITFFEKFAKEFQPLLDMAKTKDLKEKLPRDYIKERQYISDLMYEVLTDKITIREALLKFPENSKDDTALAAYHALIHYEADDELRKSDRMYADEQDDYIIYIAETLQKGEALPKHIIKEYKKFYRWAPSKYSDSKPSILEKLKRYINI